MPVTPLQVLAGLAEPNSRRRAIPIIFIAYLKGCELTRLKRAGDDCKRISDSKIPQVPQDLSGLAVAVEAYSGVSVLRQPH